ncbi:MAG: ABC transporter substrate-binding protein, partial [bacterium]
MTDEIKKYVLLFLSAFVFPGTVFGFVITDDVGRKAEIKKPVESIVSLSPGHTEMIYYLGAAEKLKAVSLQCDYPPAAKDKEKAGGFLHPDTEKIASLGPDVVISGGGIQKKAISAMEKLGISVIVFYPQSLSDIAGNMRTIAAITGCGEDKALEFDRRLKKLKEKELEEMNKVFLS